MNRRGLAIGGLSFFALWLVVSCAPSRTTISQRSPFGFEKEGKVNTVRRPIANQKLSQEIFVRQKNVAISSVAKKSDSGSLFNVEDERNYLFASRGPVSVGRFITMHVVSNRLKKPEVDPPSGGEQPATDEEGDELTKTLLESLPDLRPADPSEAVLVKRFQMKIVHRYDNGDALAQMTRRSMLDGQANEIVAQGRIPYERLVAGDHLTTDDLKEVKFHESKEGELTERRSSGWEDDYTVRLSGFDEAKSKMAMELEDKRRRLAEARDNLETKIKSFGKERRQVAKEREVLTKKRQEDQEKFQELNNRIDEQQQTIEEQQQTIEELRPEEKPGDEKDGSDGEE